MKKTLHEPLLHFALLGALLFAAYGFLNREPQASPQRIVVKPGQIEHLITTFARTWQRPPTSAEMKALVDQYVREDVLSREATKLGLEQNDTVIRRRLQQKMEFIGEDLAATTEPTEADLAAYLAKHADAFRGDQQLTFRHVYLNPEKHGEQLDADVAKLLADLKAAGAQADISKLGDPTLLERDFRNESKRRVEADFGAEFVTKLANLPPGEWTGPVLSGFGTHLVLVEQRTEGRIATLDEVRPQVRREWENASNLANSLSLPSCSVRSVRFAGSTFRRQHGAGASRPTSLEPLRCSGSLSAARASVPESLPNTRSSPNTSTDFTP